MESKISNFLIIVGAMKCGTTSLYNYLAQHPEIAACQTKETGFFSFSSRFFKGFDFYQGLWDWQPGKHKYALEATPGYTRVTNPKYLNAAEKIRLTKEETGANFKFIYILRNPVDRIESHYTQGKKHRNLEVIKSEAATIEEEIIDTSRYAMQIKEYYQRFPADDILLLRLEDLQSNPQALMIKVCDFLEIDREYSFELNLTHNSYSSKTSRVVIPGYSWLRRTDFVKNYIKFMSGDLKRRIRLIRNLLSKNIDYEYIKLSTQQREYAITELRADLIELRDKFNVDVASWGIDIE
ncbi:MAG: sulfotransferase [Cyanobacteria bacterium J06607_15]